MERKQSTMTKLKGKLISALCMLLVAATMVISSSYAWFTLSTAPEVSGITTAIGANGALEIWLNTPNTKDENYIPGNIVNLGSASYGLSTITLLPSAINMAGDKLASNFLQIPTYNETGRPGKDLDKTSVAAGLYDSTKGGFYDSTSTGVRGLGVASGLTSRQLAYRSAKQTANTNMSIATSKVVTSLNDNGAILGDIVIKKVTTPDATYTAAEVAALGNIIDELYESLEAIEVAYEEMIVALAASGLVEVSPLGDMAYQIVKSKFADGGADGLTLAKIAEAKGISVTVELDGESKTFSVNLESTALLQAITDFNETYNTVVTLKGDFDDIEPTGANGEYTWGDISAILNALINTEHVTVNGVEAKSENKEAMMNAIIAAAAKVTIQLNSGSGAYADIADHCGNYRAVIIIDSVSVSGYNATNVPATMTTNSSVDPSYLKRALVQVDNAQMPGKEGAAAMPMTEMYGFVIDLSFRTNAANSHLLLQTDPADRIYEDNNNEATQGKGSYMTYASAGELTNEQVKNLMKHIRIVFFKTDSLDIIGEARLDTEAATTDNNGVTAKMYMYEKQEYYAVGTTKYYVTETTTDGTTTYAYYTNAAKTESADMSAYPGAAAAIPEGFVKTAEYVKKTGTDADVITDLVQNQEVKVSVLVYLDGETITNADVAAKTANSVTGTMNLQFASDAELKPMEYGALHTPGTDAGNGGAQSGGEGSGEGSGT